MSPAQPSAASCRTDLCRIAHRVMIERGLQPDFSPAAVAETKAIRAARPEVGPALRDLRRSLWCSIDNDDSRDLDQLSVAESLPADAVKILVAVADVDALVKDGSAIDAHAPGRCPSSEPHRLPRRSFPRRPRGGSRRD